MSLLCSAAREDGGHGDIEEAILREREAFQTERLQWQADQRELCGRIADLELEVSNLIAVGSSTLADSGIEVELEPSEMASHENICNDSNVVIGRLLQSESNWIQYFLMLLVL